VRPTAAVIHDQTRQPKPGTRSQSSTAMGSVRHEDLPIVERFLGSSPPRRRFWLSHPFPVGASARRVASFLQLSCVIVRPRCASTTTTVTGTLVRRGQLVVETNKHVRSLMGTDMLTPALGRVSEQGVRSGLGLADVLRGCLGHPACGGMVSLRRPRFGCRVGSSRCPLSARSTAGSHTPVGILYSVSLSRCCCRSASVP
jgi:hypothetical protein